MKLLEGLVRHKTDDNFVSNEDLCGQNILLIESTVLREMLGITIDKQNAYIYSYWVCTN